MHDQKVILVTGGSGFIGANLVIKLVEKGYKVHILTRKKSSFWRINKIRKKITIHQDLLTNTKSLKKKLAEINPYAVFHLATYGSYPFQKSISNIININITGTINLLNALKDIPYKHLVIAGSSSEYGKKETPMKESDMLDPNNFYAAAKASQTHLATAYSKIYNKPAVILRLFNVYGLFEEKGRLVRTVIEAALKNEPIRLATGMEARDLLFSEDVSDVFIHAINSPQFYGEIFNIGTGKETTIYQLAEIVKKISASKSRVELNAYSGRAWDSFHWRADVKKTKKILKWHAKHTLKDGIKKTVDWYKLNS